MNGIRREHVLPTIEGFVSELTSMGRGSYMSSTDVSRAYKNFKSDPLDWPLLGFEWDEKYYCDITMPFGARSSSCHMQRVADAIVRILANKGVVARMYLDDIITLSPDYESAVNDFHIVQDLLRELGLPEATDKIQPPATNVTWLGIQIDSQAMALSIPSQKLQDVKSSVRKALKCKSMSKSHLQSVLGRLLHVAKCVRPARLFVSRLLEALRSMTRPFIRVNREMKKDLAWFRDFCAQWNGVGLIPSDLPSRSIMVDACGSGVGGTDGHVIYGGQVTPMGDPVQNICELEAANVVIALYTMLGEQDRGSHILVWSDSISAVQTFTSGRGRNKVLLDCARSLWILQACLDVKISYQHIPGVHNILADALSRVHLDVHYAKIISNFASRTPLYYVNPRLDILSYLDAPIISRNGIRIAPPAG